MSGYLIDTDWVIDYLKGVPSVVAQLQAVANEGLAISVISLAELYEGVYGSGNADQHLQGLGQFLGFVSVVGLDDAVCRAFGQYRHRLRQRGQLIDNFDLLIAATSLTYQLTLVTGNLRHYARIPGLQIAQFAQPSRGV